MLKDLIGGATIAALTFLLTQSFKLITSSVLQDPFGKMDWLARLLFVFFEKAFSPSVALDLFTILRNLHSSQGEN